VVAADEEAECFLPPDMATSVQVQRMVIVHNVLR